MSENKLTRLCHVIKREDFDGYGFNLHAEKGKPGQYIGKVDDNSPAEEAGLKQGDRIIEVNGVNIGNETHKQVVQRIKAIACEVRLSVVDPNIVIVSNNNQVIDANTNNGITQPTGMSSSNEHMNDINDGPTAMTNGKNGQSSTIVNKSNEQFTHNTLSTQSPTSLSATMTSSTGKHFLYISQISE